MFSKFDEEAQKVLLLAKKEMNELKHPYVGSEHLLLAILHNRQFSVTKLLESYGINYDKFRNELIKIIGEGTVENKWFLYTPLLKRIIENATLECKDDNATVGVVNLLISLLEEGDGVANRILMGMNVDIDALYDKFSDRFSYKSSTGYKELLLEEFAVNLNQKCIEEGFDPVVGRDDKVKRVMEILLRRTKNNPLLIGDAGVGKTAIVEELTRRIVEDFVPKELKNKRIFSLSMASMVAGTKYRGEFEERMNKIVEELELEDDIILFIDEIHTMVGAGGAEGAIDASNILKPYLARGKIKIIGATTKDEYKKYIEDDKALDRRFQKVIVEESSILETENILKKLKPIYESYHNVFIDDELIKELVVLVDRYISNGKMPDKAIDILDEVCIKASLVDTKSNKKIRMLHNELADIKNKKNMAVINHLYNDAKKYKDRQCLLESRLNKLEIEDDKRIEKRITIDNIYEVIYNKSGVPVKDILNSDLNKRCKYLSKTVIGQDKAIKEIMSIATNDKLKSRKCPYSFLLVGKSGVGKTFFVKEYAKMLFTKDSFIRLDMSEYKERHSVSKIIGSPPGYVGYTDKSSIIDKVRMHPYSVILLDEIEKADKAVLKVFLQVLDEGYMCDSHGERVNFSNTVIFMTSNIGSYGSSIGFVDNKEKMIMSKVEEFLSIEFINRLDKVVLFEDLKSSEIDKIIRMRLRNNNISFSTEIVNKIKNECNYSEFGARHVDKTIEKLNREILTINE